MADSHAALFAHGAFAAGSLKVTYGTGSSVMGLLPEPKAVGPGLCLTVAWQTDAIAYAAEGNIRATGAAPALAGRPARHLAARTRRPRGRGDQRRGVVRARPSAVWVRRWWDLDAAGLITGLTQKAGRAELARAALDAVVHQITDVVDAFGVEVGEPNELFADGGPTRSDFLMQLQADVVGRPVLRAGDPELSALGTGHLAGVGAGLWSWSELSALPRRRDVFGPRGSVESRHEARRVWQAAIERARYKPAAARQAAAALSQPAAAR